MPLPKKEKSKSKKPLWRKVIDGKEERGFTKNRSGELRLLEDGKYAEGYAAVFNVLSQDLGNFREKLQKGCFKKTIMEADVVALYNHDYNYLLGKTKSGTLELMEDDIGLKFRLLIPESPLGENIKESLRRKDLEYCSFAFYTISDEWTEDYSLRTVKECKLEDVSIVVRPAYLQTSVGLRKQGKMNNYHEIVLRKIEDKKPLSELDKKVLESYIEELRGFIINIDTKSTDSIKQDEQIQTDEQRTEAATSETAVEENQPAEDNKAVEIKSVEGKAEEGTPNPELVDNHLEETRVEPSETIQENSSETNESVEDSEKDVQSVTIDSTTNDEKKEDSASNEELTNDELVEQERSRIEKETLTRMRMIMLRKK